MISFSELVRLANTPGPQQGMARAMLQQIADEEAANNRAERIGRSHSPASGPAGLNFGDPTPGHASYPDEYMRALVDRYGVVPEAPVGREESVVVPAPEAQRQFRAEMEHYFPEPSLWDKIKSIAGGIASDPSALVEPAADLVAYGTPMIGNAKGVRDGMRDYADMMEYARNPNTDGFDVLRAYGAPLAMDVAQSVLPLGWRSSGEQAPSAIARILNRYGAAVPTYRGMR